MIIECESGTATSRKSDRCGRAAISAAHKDDVFSRKIADTAFLIHSVVMSLRRVRDFWRSLATRALVDPWRAARLCRGRGFSGPRNRPPSWTQKVGTEWQYMTANRRGTGLIVVAQHYWKLELPSNALWHSGEICATLLEKRAQADQSYPLLTAFLNRCQGDYHGFPADSCLLCLDNPLPNMICKKPS